MDTIFFFGALVAAVYYIFLRFVGDNQQRIVAAQQAADSAAHQAVLLKFRNDIWHFVVPSLHPEDDSELVNAAECRRWLIESKNPTGVKVYTCIFRDIDNHSESWDQYLVRLKAFRQRVRQERAAEFQNAQNTEGVGLTYYEQYVLRKRLPIAASFAPVFLVASNQAVLVLLTIVMFCIFGGRFMEKLLTPSKAISGNKKRKSRPNQDGDDIAEANRILAARGIKLEMNANQIMLKPKEAAKK